jgi:hypothetical protein
MLNAAQCLEESKKKHDDLELRLEVGPCEVRPCATDKSCSMNSFVSKTSNLLAALR